MPTVEEFLQYKPKRLDFEWTTGEDGRVQIKVPKFTGSLGKGFVKVMKKENVFTTNLDALGSSVWKQCDGTVTVKEILDKVRVEFPDEKDIDQRLFLFLQQLYSLCYITL
ncbi:MAG TPA: PqqD family protein [Candidatus Thermoplasmatota archaeon]|nr:PqqD family protein [Candidatus Thermoplasmatota archaeon]